MGQKSQDCLGSHVVGQRLQVQIAISLGQPPAVRGQEHRDVVIAGVGSAQKLLQVHLPGGRGEQVPAPDYFRHTGGGIVYHHSQLVHKDAVGPADQEVTAVPGQVFYVEALDPILDGNFPVWHPDPPGGGAAKSGLLCRTQIPAPAVVYVDPVSGMGCICPMQAATGAVAGIQESAGFQQPEGGQVSVGAAALGLGLPVPSEPQPGEVLAELRGIAFPGALGI